MPWTASLAASGYLTVLMTVLAVWVRGSLVREGAAVHQEIVRLRAELQEAGR